ncbi:hypothetical protein SAMN05216187_1271 [Jeotgalicoccus aerolatus]|uniref:Type I toxin-antitoxin system Fst family toxin n=1 Tax=Jeotgalicoccus aerolatus TaxID=709510 RepID=A0A1G9EXW2_9STAP|nr:hypothetical protein SAMN05216187_1271 [Jeotgalicoccus aerolatus]
MNDIFIQLFIPIIPSLIANVLYDKYKIKKNKLPKQ